MSQVIFHVPDDFYFHERFTASLIAFLCERIVENFFDESFKEISLTFNNTKFEAGISLESIKNYLMDEKTEVNSITINRLINQPLSLVIFLEGSKMTHAASFTISSKSTDLNLKVYKFLKQEIVEIKRNLVLEEAEQKKEKQKSNKPSIKKSFGIPGLARQLEKSHSLVRQKQKLFYSHGIVFFKNEISWNRFVDSIWAVLSQHTSISKVSIHAIREPINPLRLKGTKEFVAYLNRENLDQLVFRISDDKHRRKQDTFSIELQFKKAVDSKRGIRYSMKISVSSKKMEWSKQVGESLIQIIFLELEQHRQAVDHSVLQGDFFRSIKPTFENNFQCSNKFDISSWIRVLKMVSTRRFNERKAKEAFGLIDDLKYAYLFLPEMSLQLEEIIKRKGIKELVWLKRTSKGEFLRLLVIDNPIQGPQIELTGRLNESEDEFISDLMTIMTNEKIGIKSVENIAVHQVQILENKDLHPPEIIFPKDRNQVSMNSQQFDFDGQIEKDVLFDLFQKIDQAFLKDQALLISTNWKKGNKKELFNSGELEDLWAYLEAEGFPDQLFSSKINSDKDFFSISLNFGDKPYGVVSSQSTEADFEKMLEWVQNFFNPSVDLPKTRKKKKDEAIQKKSVAKKAKAPSPASKTKKKQKKTPRKNILNERKHVSCSFVPNLSLTGKKFIEVCTELDRLFGDDEQAEALVEMNYGKVHHYSNWIGIRDIELLIDTKKVSSIVLELKKQDQLVFELSFVTNQLNSKTKKPKSSFFEAILENHESLKKVENLILDNFSISRDDKFIEYKLTRTKKTFELDQVPYPEAFRDTIKNLIHDFNKHQPVQVTVITDQNPFGISKKSKDTDLLFEFIDDYDHHMSALSIKSEANYPHDIDLNLVFETKMGSLNIMTVVVESTIKSSTKKALEIISEGLIKPIQSPRIPFQNRKFELHKNTSIELIINRLSYWSKTYLSNQKWMVSVKTKTGKTLISISHDSPKLLLAIKKQDSKIGRIRMFNELGPRRTFNVFISYNKNPKLVSLHLVSDLESDSRLIDQIVQYFSSP